MITNFKIELKDIQHIKALSYEIDLSKNQLHCIVGKNGVGKTTLIKAIENLKETNTLDKLSRLNIISDSSKIIYTIDNQSNIFTPILDGDRYILDSSTPISEIIKSGIFTELPIPLGIRFNEYGKLGGAIGEKIKTQFSLTQYDAKPDELIELLKSIYGHSNFDTLEQISIEDTQYYILPLDDKNYIREDDFSSGEYMIIQIYKLIKKQCKLIVIDELDISLDSSAQVNLLKKLREFTSDHNINILFTTHSLAVMKSLKESELFYMETVPEQTSIQNKSYNYIKSLLFQFEGYDKIILTEDKMLVIYIEYLLRDETQLFSKYKIIDIAGHGQTVDLMQRNKELNFLGTKTVISLLDGDQSQNPKYRVHEDIFYIPFESIEKDLYQEYLQGNLDSIIDSRHIDTKSIESAKPNKKPKVLYRNLTGRSYMSNIEIIEYLNRTAPESVTLLKEKLITFLNQGT
jgi:ABC-type dipeptide/oligopeptide/nickel transport system ATPase subunit